MNAQVLIDAVVRQVTVLIAQLATAGGVRAPLSHVANQVFVDLAKELSAQGVSRKVSADMFGMALRAYLRKLRRLDESATVRGRSLWSAVLDALGEHGPLDRDQVLTRFGHDDEAQVRAVLHDLVDSGLVFSTGRSDCPVYRALTPQELGHVRARADSDGFDRLLWVQIDRDGPLGIEQLRQYAAGSAQAVDEAIERLLADGCIERRGAQYVALDFRVPLGASHGWEAAMLDHIYACVQTICQRLGAGGPSHADDEVGGSTFSFDVWPGHPLEGEVRASLARLRAGHLELLSRVQAHNAQHGRPETHQQVVVYAGQCIRERGLAEPGTDGTEVTEATEVTRGGAP